jgi:CRP-like cAMP-binding protein
LEGNKLAAQTRATNRVLASVPAGEYKRLQTHLEPIELKFGQVLYEPGEPIRHVYFPLDCLISLLTGVDKRRTLEVGVVGNEGMAGMPFILGMGVSGVRAIVQGGGGGSALRMASAPFRIEFKRNVPLQEGLYRYTYALMAQISQTAACNRFHNAEQRLSRWLLMTRDRVGSNGFLLTHEFLAHMLGLRREGVTEAATALTPFAESCRWTLEPARPYARHRRFWSMSALLLCGNRRAGGAHSPLVIDFLPEASMVRLQAIKLVLPEPLATATRDARTSSVVPLWMRSAKSQLSA